MQKTQLDHSAYHGRVNPNSIMGSVLVALACVFIFYLVPHYIEEPGMVRNPLMSPRFLPLVAGWFVLLFSVVLMLEGALRPPKLKADEHKHTGLSPLRWGLMLAAGAVYMLLFESLGAIASGVIATVLLFIAHNMRQFNLYFLALAFPIVVSLLFVHVLNVPLPDGTIWE